MKETQHYGMKTKRLLYDLDDQYFTIPNEENSYWAGLLAADGSISQNSVKLKLSIKDESTLLLMKDAVSYTGPILKTTDKIGEKSFAQRILYVSSHDWVHYLGVNFNITPRKTHTLIPPNLTNILDIRAFIVGYIDGDGNVGYAGKSPILQVIGTREMLNWIKYHIDTWYTERCSAKVLPRGKMYRYSVSGVKVKTFAHDVSISNIPFMKRKWNSVI